MAWLPLSADGFGQSTHLSRAALLISEKAAGGSKEGRHTKPLMHMIRTRYPFPDKLAPSCSVLAET